MKKKILIILSIWLVISVVFGICYKNFSHKYSKLVTIQPISTGYKAAKEPFKTIGLEIANITLNRTGHNRKPFINKMREFGAKKIVIDTRTYQPKFAKTLPPVIIGGKKYENKSVCTIVSYEYKGEMYEVGNCK